MSGDSLSAIDQNLMEVVDCCVSSGLSPDQISRSASPLLILSKKSKRKTWMKRVVMVSTAVAVLAFVLHNAWTFRWICVAGKYLEKKVLPYWDWTALYEEECLFPNPYMVYEQLTEDDCGCDGLIKLEVLHNVSTEEVSDEYLFDNIPFVVTDATQKWKGFAEFNSDFIKKLYTKHEVMRSHEVCQYKNKNNQGLAQVLSDKVPFFHASWVNCKLAPIKVFRRFYQRPYFLPPMVESATENFVAFSSGWTDESSEEEGDSFLELYSGDDMTWFAQMRGSYLIQLKPKVPCDNICHKLEFALHEGETVVVTNSLWELWFAPLNDLPTIAIGSTGNWDSN